CGGDPSNWTGELRGKLDGTRWPSNVPRWRGRIILVDCFEHRCDKAAFFFAELRPPDIEDQNDADLVAAVVGLVLDRVVERPGFTFAPTTHVVSDAEHAIVRHDERQVTDQPRVQKASVGWNPHSRLQQRKQDRWRAALDLREWRVL